jgi:Ca2+/H+ antiporter
MLFLVVAILLPAVFGLTERVAAPGINTSLIDERLSLGVSVVLLLLYAANLIYTLLTHRDMFAGDAASGQAEWSVARALAGREPIRRGCLLDDAVAPIPAVQRQPGNLSGSGPQSSRSGSASAWLIVPRGRHSGRRA